MGKKLWEGMVGVLVKIFENPPAEQVGARIPLSGTFSDPKAGLWPTATSFLRNAFVEALKPQLEGSIQFRDI